MASGEAMPRSDPYLYDRSSSTDEGEVTLRRRISKCNGCSGAYFAQIVDLQILTDTSELILQEYVTVRPELPK
jgi:hypothetical protein